MSKLVFLALFLVLSMTSFAGEVVLITSLQLKTEQSQLLERNFLNTFQDSGHIRVVYHKADPFTLHRVMNSEETEAVIWVSHAAADNPISAGVKNGNVIIDIFGNDVKKFFSTVPKNLRFLGIVGCEAKQVMDGFVERGNFRNAPDLELKSFSRNVNMMPAFLQTLRRAKLSLKRPKIERAVEETVEISMERESMGVAPGLQAGWAELGDKVIAVFPENEIHPTGEVKFPHHAWLKAGGDSAAAKNIKYYRLKHLQSKSEGFGKLTIAMSDDSGTWSLFADRDGRALGGGDQQLYIYKLR